MTEHEYEELSERIEQYQEASNDLESAENMMYLLNRISENDCYSVEIKVTRHSEDGVAKQLEPEETIFTPSGYTADVGVWREGLRQLIKKHITFTKEYIYKL